MPSPFGKRHRKRRIATPANFAPLTEAELAEVALSRAQAAERALAYADAISDEEEARLTAAAESDPDNPLLTEENWRRMRPAHEVHPELVARSLRRERGRPKQASTKEQVTLRIDPDVLAHFRKSGSGWQTRINEALKRAVERARGAGGKRAR